MDKHSEIRSSNQMHDAHQPAAATEEALEVSGYAFNPPVNWTSPFLAQELLGYGIVYLATGKNVPPQGRL
jgi:hypothetical protein